MRIPYVGLQRGRVQQTENPLEAVWQEISRIGTAEYIASLEPETEEIDWDALSQYSAVRIRQAVELRQSSVGISLLTRPIPIYYSLLNLLRAVLATVTEKEPARHHGLTFIPGETLYECRARVTAQGTVAEYLEFENPGTHAKQEYTLLHSLSGIAELYQDFQSPDRGLPIATRLRIEAIKGNNLLIKVRFPFDKGVFDAHWKSLFPQLADVGKCELDDVAIRCNVMIDTPDDAAKFCSEYLWNSLYLQHSANWFLPRKDYEEPLLPRMGYYIVAAFILSNVSRYHPELLSDVVAKNSEIGWFLSRFLDSAERFFPQLILGWFRRTPVYFTT